MDSTSFSFGLRVIVAAKSLAAANSTAEVLHSLSYHVSTCTSEQELKTLLQQGPFDLMLAESYTTAPHSALDGLKLLELDGIPPVVGRPRSSVPPFAGVPAVNSIPCFLLPGAAAAVAMEDSSAAAKQEVLRRGAVAVMPLPMHKQRDHLENLWQYSLQRQGSMSYTSQVSCCTELDFSELLGTDNAKDDFLNLDDLNLEPLDCEYVCPGDRGHPGSVLDVSFLNSPSPGSSSVEDNLTGFEMHGANEAMSSIFSMGAVPKRTWSDMESLELVKPDDSLAAASSGASSESLELSAADSAALPEAKPSPAAKKAKFEWTPALEAKFSEAVKALGDDKAVPSRILELMDASGSGLTRQHIASHLQKHRNRGRRGSGQPGKQPPAKKQRNTAATAAGAAVIAAGAAVKSPAAAQRAPVQHGSPILIAPPQQQQQQQQPHLLSHVLQAAPPPHIVQQQQHHHHLHHHHHQQQQQQQHWVQMWGPSLHHQGAVLYGQLGQPLVAQLPQAPAPAPAPAHQQAGWQGKPSAEEVQRAIKEVLAHGKAPLGLALDTKTMLKTIQASGSMCELLASTVATAAA